MTPNLLPRPTSVQLEDAGMVPVPAYERGLRKAYIRGAWHAHRLYWQCRREAERAEWAGDRDWYLRMKTEAIRHWKRAAGYCRSLRERGH